MTFWQWLFQLIWMWYEFESKIDKLFHLIHKVQEGERLRLAGEGGELVGVGGAWMFPLVATGGNSSFGR